MNDFWEWMKEKDYGRWDNSIDAPEEGIFLLYAGYVIRPTKQMLIGYMMEYLQEQKGKIVLNNNYECYVYDIKKVERENLLKRMVGDE